MTTTYKIYYTDPVDSRAYAWDETTINGALSITETFRKQGMTFVTMVCENTDSVGKPGVDSIVDGKTPDGKNYTWVKRR